MNQILNYGHHCIVDEILTPLLAVGARMTIDFFAVLALVIEIVPIRLPVRTALSVDVAIHSSAADRAAEKTGKNVFMLQAVGLFFLAAIVCTFLLCQVPIGF